MRSLGEWLAYIERQHPQPIALGLERMAQVLVRLRVRLECPVITVGGTNGKGSTCALAESILRAAGMRTALYTSPHLVRYNERVRIAGSEADDAALCEAFAAIEAERKGVPLTYFEFGTLAALWLFAREKPEAAILEVGLGGRLDAVNIIDADCAVITSIGIDHVEYLGGSRESIAREKAGIFRDGRPAVIGEPDPPQPLLAAPGEKLLLGRDFGYTVQGTQWSYWGPAGKRPGLAHPALRGAVQLRNAAAALCALESLKLPITMQEIRSGLAQVTLAGRFQVLPGRPQVILDVAHNPEAAITLERNLAASGFAPQTIAVGGMLRDKDIAGVLGAIAPRITRWHLASLSGPRAARASELAAHVPPGDTPVFEFDSPAQAFAGALSVARENDKILVFGSFLTVGEVLEWLKKNNKTSIP